MSALLRLKINKEKYKKDEQLTNAQKQTKETFGYKWLKEDTYESSSMLGNARKWLLERYCNNDINKLKGWLSEGGKTPKIILDAGCGAAFSALLLFGELLKKHDYLGVDISDSIYVAERRFVEKNYPGEFLQCSIMNLPIPDACIDMIFSEGVLHHTDSTEEAIKYLATKLKTNGLFLFYVYRKKAVVREYTDDYIRNAIEGMNNEDAWEALKPLTKLGKKLGELKINIQIEDDIPFLGIKKGTLDLQRFFYWNICKLFYKPEYSLEEMNHINFDWFRPLNCHRHTEEEIRMFCQSANMKIDNFNIQEAGFTIVARKY